jgi:arylsulfatase A
MMKMKKRNTVLLAVMSVLSVYICSCFPEEKKQPVRNPNILMIYTDDLGYGDIAAYNSNSKIPTPNIDRLAQEGISFMDAHSPAAICGPSRYSLLTGRYAWREPGGTVNPHALVECIIEKGRPTIASILKDNGYNTAQMGKWGLRHDCRAALKDPNLPLDSITPESFDHSKPIYAANTRGFEYALSLVMLNRNKNRWLFENGFSLNGTEPDPDNFDWYSCLPTLTNKVMEYLDTYAGVMEDTAFRINRDKPFFIYFDPHVPHGPIVPNEEYLGKSDAGDYGDFVVELDDAVGSILNTLDRHGLTKNTLVIFSSDNGPESWAYERIREHDHYSMYKWRGVKRDIWEGGHRVPFIARWPEKIEQGSISEEPIGLIDMMATISALTNSTLPDNAAEDSYDISPVLLGQEYAGPVREPQIYHSYDQRFAIRDGEWVFIDAPSGMVSQEPAWFRELRDVQKHDLDVELYNLKNDPQQRINVARKYPEKVVELKAKMESIMNRKPSD